MKSNIAIKLVGEKLFSIDEMLNSTPSCFKIITSEGILLNMNARGLSLIEAENLESVVGKNVYDLIEESHLEKFIEFNNRICSGGKSTLIYQIIGLQGTRRWMESYAAPYTLTNGEVAHLAITNDITERIIAEEKAIQQKLILEETSRLAALGQFVSGIAHEINNPLTVIAGKVLVLQDKLDTNMFDHGDFKKDLKTVEDTIFRISKIIDGLKTLSRDPSQIAKGHHSLSMIVRETLNLCTESHRLNKVVVTVDIPDDITVFCNPVQISQVVMNLLNNSHDAILNSKDKWIKINAKSSDSCIQLTVTDSGEKISEDVALNMLNPFFTTKEIGHGTGLGLSICVGILKCHDGFFTYNKDFPHTQFLLQIPKIKSIS